jgi:F-box domain
MQLLGLPDELLSEILKHIGVGDKVQHVQRCCMRFRRLLQQPVAPDVWGSIGVRLIHDQIKSIEHLAALLQWLASRQAGDRSKNQQHRVLLVSVFY